MSFRKTVLCVTPNVSVDWIHLIPGFVPGRVWRPASVSPGCGGKGVNVARAVQALGERAVCAGVLAGHAGHIAAEMAEAEGLEGRWTWIEGETRTNVIVVDPAGGHPTVLNAPGPTVDAIAWTRFTAAVLDEASSADCVCLCGSLPPGRETGDIGALVSAVRALGKPVWVDTTGPVLEEALLATPTGIKINAEEAGDLLGRPVRTVDDAVAAAQALRGDDIEAVVLTLGRQGAVAVTEDETWRTEPPLLRTANPIGSGDAFLGGLATALLNGHPMPGALRYATAAGSAAALCQSTPGLEPEAFKEVLKGVQVMTVSRRNRAAARR